MALLLVVAAAMRPPPVPGRGPTSAAPAALDVQTGSHDVTLVVDGSATAADERAVEWARDRYREAGLALPARLRVTFHDDTDPCHGAQGGFTVIEGVSTVLVCLSEQERARSLPVNRTLLHEFAHAWDHATLDDRVRTAFRHFRGADGWLSEDDVAWADLAGEQAAETIMWGLMDEPFLMGSVTEPWSWEELHDGYVMLTGTEPPHGYVWSWFAVSPRHEVYAHTPAQLEIVQRAWDQAADSTQGLRSQKVRVRFHRDPAACDGAATSSQQVEGRLDVHACAVSPEVLATQLLRELTTGSG